MSLKNISLNRPVTSYAKVRSFLSAVTRGKKIFIKQVSVKNKTFLNVGCGPYPEPGFINLDYGWHPQIDICWDIAGKPYPLKDNSLEGIFTEHCLEHISFDSCLENLKEFYRLLKPGGTLRIIVPDGEIYCDLYIRRKANAAIVLPYGEKEETGMISINRIFRSHGHLFIYDYETFELLLKKAGFIKIKKAGFGIGNDNRLLIDREERKVESLYVEAVK